MGRTFQAETGVTERRDSGTEGTRVYVRCTNCGAPVALHAPSWSPEELGPIECAKCGATLVPRPRQIRRDVEDSADESRSEVG